MLVVHDFTDGIQDVLTSFREVCQLEDGISWDNLLWGGAVPGGESTLKHTNEYFKSTLHHSITKGPFFSVFLYVILFRYIYVFKCS